MHFSEKRCCVLRVKQLDICYNNTQLLKSSFDLHESLALIGESGSGKSLTLKALLSMVPQNLEVTLDVDAPFPLEAGKTIGFVPQNPFTALSPLTKIKKQFFAPMQRVEQLFDELGLDSAFLDRYPAELSGGQLQRVVIAMALEFHPKLLLLDEPTTALDSSTKQMILALLKKLQKQEGFSFIFVTHDIYSVHNLCKEVCVLYKGVIIERGSMQEVFANPQQSYTKKLIEANFATRSFRE